jgi:hypothetical protein
VAFDGEDWQLIGLDKIALRPHVGDKCGIRPFCAAHALYVDCAPLRSHPWRLFTTLLWLRAPGLSVSLEDHELGSVRYHPGGCDT